MHDNAPPLSPRAGRLTAVTQTLLLLSLLLAGLAFEVFAQERPTRRARGAEARPRAQARRRAGRSLAPPRAARTPSAQTDDNVEETVEEVQEDRLEWFVLQRTYPHASFNLPPRARSSALEKTWLKRGLSARQFRDRLDPRAEAQPRWRPLGSATIESFGQFMRPTTGRVTAVAVSPVDPNLILVGAATGGIWRSTDAGRSFAPVTDTHTELAVGSIAFSKSDPSVVYAGMGDATAGYLGTGVLKSTNGGLDWVRASDQVLPLATISKVLVDPTDHRRVYLAQHKFLDPLTGGTLESGGFHFSADGGATWSDAVRRGLPRDLAIHPTDPNTLYLALTDPPAPAGQLAAVFKSTNGGRDWERILTPAHGETPEHKFNFKIGLTPAAPETVYVHVTHHPPTGRPTSELLVSTDGGRRWDSLGAPRIVDIGVWFLAVDPADPLTLYIGSGDLFKSTDGGSSWENLSKNWTVSDSGNRFSAGQALSHTDQRAYAFSPDDRRIIYVGNDGGFWRSDSRAPADGRRLFEPLNDHLPVAQFTSITAHPSDANTVYVGTHDNGALIFRSGSSGWREFTTGDSGGVILDRDDPRVAFVSLFYGIIDRYVDADPATKCFVAKDATFGEPREPNQRPRIAFYPPFTSDPTTGRLYFGTWRLFFSSDKGRTWRETTPGEDLTKGACPQFKSDVLSVIGVSPSRRGVIYTGSACGRVRRTTDEGRTWEDIMTGLPNRFVKSILVDPADPRTVYLTVSGFGTGHVFKTTDGGANWADISDGLPNVPANALLIDPLDKNVLYVGTDAGVFRSTTNGGTWQALDLGLPPVVVTDFAVKADNTVLIATYGRGAYELVRRATP